jgi:hypothetical protein
MESMLTGEDEELAHEKWKTAFPASLSWLDNGVSRIQSLY